MHRWRGFILALTRFCSGTPVPGVCTGARSRNDDAQRGLTGIEGDVYLMQDSSGRWVEAYVDKSTQRERLVVPGESIEVQLSPDITGRFR